MKNKVDFFNINDYLSGLSGEEVAKILTSEQLSYIHDMVELDNIKNDILTWMEDNNISTVVDLDAVAKSFMLNNDANLSYWENISVIFDDYMKVSNNPDINLIHYEGMLGTFDYDPDVFNVKYSSIRRREFLCYIGDCTDGKLIHIPEGITNCSRMFKGCESLVTPPVIPNGVTDCSWMFYNCESLKVAPVIPDGVSDCSLMLNGCTSLVSAPVIPDSVENCWNMFGGCSDEVQMQGQWNIEHCGMNYLQDYVEENETDELY